MFNAWRIVKAKRRRNEDFRSQKRPRTARQKGNPDERFDRDEKDAHLNLTEEEYREIFLDLEDAGEYLYERTLQKPWEYRNRMLINEHPYEITPTRFINTREEPSADVDLQVSDYMGSFRPSLSSKIWGVSASDVNKGTDEKLLSKLGDLMDTWTLRVFKSKIGQGYLVYMNDTKIIVGKEVPDAVAQKVLDELNNFNGKDKRIYMNKNGEVSSSPAKYTREIEPSRPNPPRAGEQYHRDSSHYRDSGAMKDKDTDFWRDKSNRWENEPSEKDKKTWGWMQQLEQTDDMEKYDWEIQFSSEIKNIVWDDTTHTIGDSVKDMERLDPKKYQATGEFSIVIYHGDELQTHYSIIMAICPSSDTRPPQHEIIGSEKVLDWRRR